MPNKLSTLLYDIIRLIASLLPLKDSLRLSVCSRRLQPLYDYNHDPRLDNQFAVSKGVEKRKWTLLETIILVPYVAHEYLFRMAAAHGQDALMQRIMKIREFPLTSMYHAFWIAACKGHVCCMQLLLNSSRGLDPASSNNLTLRVASYSGRADVVKLLLNDARVDPLVNDNECIIMADKLYHYPVVQIYLHDDRINPQRSEARKCLWRFVYWVTGSVDRLLSSIIEDSSTKD
jgi:hypothetical protein